MFEVAQDRVNYLSWPLVVNGIALELEGESSVFSFDGITYPSIEDAIKQFSDSFYLDQDYFKKVIFLLGEQRFAKAVRFCRLLVDASRLEKKQALAELAQEQALI